MDQAILGVQSTTVDHLRTQTERTNQEALIDVSKVGQTAVPTKRQKRHSNKLQGKD